MTPENSVISGKTFFFGYEERSQYFYKTSRPKKLEHAMFFCLSPQILTTERNGKLAKSKQNMNTENNIRGQVVRMLCCC